MCSTFDNQSEQDERMLHASRATNQPHEQTRTNLFNEPKVTSQPLTTEDESAERKSEYNWLLREILMCDVLLTWYIVYQRVFKNTMKIKANNFAYTNVLDFYLLKTVFKSTGHVKSFCKKIINTSKWTLLDIYILRKSILFILNCRIKRNIEREWKPQGTETVQDMSRWGCWGVVWTLWPHLLLYQLWCSLATMSYLSYINHKYNQGLHLMNTFILCWCM